MQHLESDHSPVKDKADIKTHILARISAQKGTATNAAKPAAASLRYLQLPAKPDCDTSLTCSAILCSSMVSSCLHSHTV